MPAPDGKHGEAYGNRRKRSSGEFGQADTAEFESPRGRAHGFR